MKTVLTVHDCRYLTLPELYRPQEVDNYRQQMKTSLKHVDMVASVSEFTRQEVLDYFSIPEDRIRVIHNGFSPYRPRESSHDEKVERFIEKNKFPQSYLLYAGTLDPRKNLLRLIEATARCRKESHDSPDLVIIGVSKEQFLRSEQGNRARELGIFDHIHLGGVVEKDVLWGLMKEAICLCYPSLHEGFGFPPLEAMSLGVPVLAGNRSSIPEITGHAACLVDPESVDDIAQGLNRIVSDSGYRQILIESGYRQIAKFSWEKAAAEYISLYKEVLDS